MGGRGGDMRKSDINMLYNDIWTSENGRDWELAMEHAGGLKDEFAAGVLHKTVEWGPQKSIMIIFGNNDQMDGSGALGDTWTSDGTEWIEDYQNERILCMWHQISLSKLGTMTDKEIQLNGEGIIRFRFRNGQ